MKPFLWCGTILMCLWFCSLPLLVADEDADKTPADVLDEYEEDIPDEDVDDTPEVETENTIDAVEKKRGWGSDGDLRPIIDYTDLDRRDNEEDTEGRLGFRARLGVDWGVTNNLKLGSRLAGLCFTSDCDLDFVMESASPQINGLGGGQFTLDELYLQWSRRRRFVVAFGRLQTRFVLRGGVYAKSLDRNDSNNVNVTWTDGLHTTFRAQNGWNSHFILQRNARDGTGSIRRGLLDFDDNGARNTYFGGVENRRAWGPVAQRAFDVSYLPDSLLKDGDPNGRREDYWGLVGRLATRWPQRSEGPRFRGGLELGYAPETPTEQALQLGVGNSEDLNGLAWDITASVMDFKPDHSIGVNYAQTGAGWFLSPQFRPNEELFEIRYQWRPEHFPLLEARVRFREDLRQVVGAAQKRRVLDFYLRLTWEFDLKRY